MKNRKLHIQGIIQSVLAVIGTLIFGIMNFENITYAKMSFSINCPDPTKSLHARYHNWIEDEYGFETGFKIVRKIEHFTYWMIEHHINELMLTAIILMMVDCVWINKHLNKKMNKVLLVYFILSVIGMLWVTYVAGPEYVDSIFDA